VERDSFKTLLEQATAAHEAERSQLEGMVEAAVARRERIAKGFADQRVEMQAVADHAKSLEPLATAGRTALEVGRELLAAVDAADAASRAILARSTLDSTDRAELETLRASTIRALLQVRQIIKPNSDGSQTSAQECA
jgi:hypothetical protein